MLQNADALFPASAAGRVGTLNATRKFRATMKLRLQLVAATGRGNVPKGQRYPWTTCRVFSSVIESGQDTAPWETRGLDG